MRQTLFFIPHAFLGIPVLGFGWALGGLILIAIAMIVTLRKKQSLSSVLQDQGVVWAVAAAIILFLLPQIETRIPDGTPMGWPVGLPVRGYGVMLMLGVVSAMAIAMHRCKRAGISQESFFSLATWVIVAGLFGARLFYVVQKWSELDGQSLSQKIWSALKVTEGGLVVYGSVIGGLIAAVLWSRKNRAPLLAIADAITPAFFIGLAFGRVGCLLNGCCYGGICESNLPSIAFPAGSPAYIDQIRSGKLLGMVTDQPPSPISPQSVRVVRESTWAAQNGIASGQMLLSVDETAVDGPTPSEPLAPLVFEAEVKIDDRTYQVPSSEIPTQSMRVHPSQIYAAVSGAVLCLWTFLLGAIALRPGFVVGAGLVAYGVFRVMEEFIRVDEAGQFGTSLSIAQWISLAGIMLGAGLMIYSRRRAPLNHLVA